VKKLLLTAALLLLGAAPSYGAVGVTEPTAEVVNTANTNIYSFGSFTPSTNSLLVITATCSGTVDDGAITNTSGTALTWTRVTSRNFNTTDTIYIFWGRTAGTTAASVYTIDLTGDNASGCIGHIFQVTGADQTTSNPIRQFKTNAATSTNATTGTLDTATLTGSALIAAWGGQLSSSNPANVSAPPTSWTEIGDNGFNTPPSQASAAYLAGGGTATSYSFTNNSTNWGLVFIEVYESGAGPVGGRKNSPTW
jgi:hypothetical protein